jgi:hypothetical protein
MLENQQFSHLNKHLLSTYTVITTVIYFVNKHRWESHLAGSQETYNLMIGLHSLLHYKEHDRCHKRTNRKL